MLGIILTAVITAQPVSPEVGKFVYDLTMGDKKGEAIHILDTVRVNGDLLHFFTSVIKIEGKIVDSSFVVFRGDFSPIKSEKYINTGPAGKIIVKTQYKGDKATINLSTPQGEKEIDIKLKDATYDNEEIVLLLPHLDFKGKEELKINDLAALSGSIVKIKVKNLGEDTVKVDDKAIAANGYRLEFYGRKIDIYYSTDSKRMVLYRDEAQKLVMKLKPTE